MAQQSPVLAGCDFLTIDPGYNGWDILGLSWFLLFSQSGGEYQAANADGQSKPKWYLRHSFLLKKASGVRWLKRFKRHKIQCTGAKP
jgi:hypothetical protein